MITKNEVCTACQKTQPDMVEVSFPWGDDCYCAECWTRLRFDHAGRDMWRQVGDRFVLREWKRIGDGFYIVKD